MLSISTEDERLEGKLKRLSRAETVSVADLTLLWSILKKHNVSDSEFIDATRGGAGLRFGDALRPPERAPRSAELEARLERLREDAERREYERMVADVERPRREAEQRFDDAKTLRNTSTSLSLVANMIISVLTMFTFGYYVAKRSYPNDDTWPLVCGLFCAIGILLVETFMFIIAAATRYDEPENEKKRK